jgi:hypothetical protein
MYKLLTIIFCFLLAENLIACECPEAKSIKKLDSSSFQSHDIVLIGRINHINSKQYSIEVIEVLKGKTNSKIIIGIYSDIYGDVNSCAFYPHFNNEYLLYLKEVKNSHITYYFADQCSANRSLDLKDCPVSLNNFNKNDLIQITKDWIEELEKLNKLPPTCR